MDFSHFGGLSRYDDGDHAIDLHNPHFRREQPSFHGQSHFQQQSNHYAHGLSNLAVDVKPRLTKEQHDVLESHYQQQNKPNTQTKKGFAETLGVSLDKVNNWFQNRRAKSKQDAKKQAGGFSVPQHRGQHNQFAMIGDNNTSDVGEYYGFNDSAVNVNLMSNGLGISQAEQQLQMAGQAYNLTGNMNADMTMGDFTNNSVQRPRLHKAVSQAFEDNSAIQRTLTAEEFNAFNFGLSFPSTSTEPIINSSSDTNGFFSELVDLSFDNTTVEPLTSEPMQPSYSAQSYLSSSSTNDEPPPLYGFPSASSTNTQTTASSGNTSDWSENAPSLSITPAVQQSDPFQATSGANVSPTNTSQMKSSQWQPGQSVPVDYAAMNREFKEASLRNMRPQALRSQSVPFVEQPLAYPSDDTYLRNDSTFQLTQDIQQFGLGEDGQTAPKERSATGSIASRRQRPRPAALGADSLRSASFCGHLPISPNAPIAPQGLAGGQTLRRIKSSNVMNGIASGRIQKNSIGSAQRSPMNFALADGGAAAPPRFTRRVSSYSLARPGISAVANLAPPTPLSPTDVSGMSDLQRSWPPWQQSGQMARQQSIHDDNGIDVKSLTLQSSNTLPTNMSSPPATPLYAAQLARGRLASMAVAENTPPQSAPASQSSFANAMMASAPAMQSQSQTMFPMMSNDYTQTHNAVLGMQQQSGMQGGQYTDLPMQYRMVPMVDTSGNLQLQYPDMGYAQMMSQEPSPPNMQFPFVPSSPGVLGSSQPQKQTPAADFFVHEYSPPQDVKRVVTPRKATDSGPKNYTFANHGPEHFEKVKKEATASPSSSTSSASSATA